MSERIFIPPGGAPNSGDVTSQEAAFDIRYTGVIPKKRFHPRLLVRKFRTTPTQSPALTEFNPALVLENFILESITEPVEEKVQIIQTFGPDFAFFYGHKPRIFTYTGRLYNTVEKPWKNEWQAAWDRGIPVQTTSVSNQRSIISGSNVVYQGGIARLEYDGSIFSGGLIQQEGRSNIGLTASSDIASAVIVREGYLLSLDIQMDSKMPNSALFKFSMYVTNLMDYYI